METGMWTPQVLIAALALVVTAMSLATTIFARRGDHQAKDREDLQRRMDSLATDLATAKRDLDVLHEKVRNIPNVNERIEALEERLERRLEAMTQQLRDLIEQVASHVKCPYNSK
jgi:flagellar motility protein MotE (MotC chaperone)